MLDQVLIEAANTLLQWQRRAYTAEARVEELEALMDPAEIIGE